MRIPFKYALGQSLIIICLPFIFACTQKNDEKTGNAAIQVLPPVTSPLSRDYIGFGVITASFTHVTADPFDGSSSLGYLRRGTLVRVLRRQTIRANNNFVTWVFIDGPVQGWLKEEVVAVYDNESQAITASQAINR
jgi:hypothetical protein